MTYIVEHRVILIIHYNNFDLWILNFQGILQIWKNHLRLQASHNKVGFHTSHPVNPRLTLAPISLSKNVVVRL
jgi:hypothetical protein